MSEDSDSVVCSDNRILPSVHPPTTPILLGIYHRATDQCMDHMQVFYIRTAEAFPLRDEEYSQIRKGLPFHTQICVYQGKDPSAILCPLLRHRESGRTCGRRLILRV